MGSCYGLLPGMAEATTPITLGNYTGEDADTITVKDATVKVEGKHTWSSNVIGGTTSSGAVIDNVTISSGTDITLNGDCYLAVGSGSNATLTIDGSTITG